MTQSKWTAAWSRTSKSKDIKVISDNICQCTTSERRSIRGEYPLPLNGITKWNIVWYDRPKNKSAQYHFVGICTNDSGNKYESLAYWDCFKNCYGMDSNPYRLYQKVKTNKDSPFKMSAENNVITQLEYNPSKGKLIFRRLDNKDSKLPKEYSIDLKNEDKKTEYYPCISFHCAGNSTKCKITQVGSTAVVNTAVKINTAVSSYTPVKNIGGSWVAAWSKVSKSKDIVLVSNNVCHCKTSERRSIRAKNALPLNAITKWNIVWSDRPKNKSAQYHFVGICTDNKDNKYESLAYWDCFKNCYGMDSNPFRLYRKVKTNKDSKFKMSAENGVITQLEYNPSKGNLTFRRLDNNSKLPKQEVIEILPEDMKNIYYPCISFHCGGTSSKCTITKVDEKVFEESKSNYQSPPPKPIKTNVVKPKPTVTNTIKPKPKPVIAKPKPVVSNNNGPIFKLLQDMKLHNEKTTDGILYHVSLVDNGYDEVEDVYDVTFDELIEYNWKKGHARKFIRLVAKLKPKKAPKMDDENSYYVKQPYVIILGISKYKGDTFNDLAAVRVDVDNMYKLFTQNYGYKYVFKSLDKLVIADKTFNHVKRTTLRTFLEYHRNEINKLNEDRKVIDSVIFLFSGHGSQEGVITSDVKVLKFTDINYVFNNETIESLEGSCFLFCFDCCRALQHNETQGKALGSKGGNRNKDYINSLSDQFIWNATSDGFVAKESVDKNGSIFLNSIHNIMLNSVTNDKTYQWDLQGQIATRVNKLVLNSGKGIQMPDPQNKLRHLVYFIPNKN